MPGEHDRLVRQRVELAANGAGDRGRVAAGQIGAPDAAAEKRVSRDHFAFERKVQRNTARRVPGGVQHMGFDRPGAENVAFVRGRVDPRVFGVSMPSQAACIAS